MTQTAMFNDNTVIEDEPLELLDELEKTNIEYQENKS